MIPAYVGSIPTPPANQKNIQMKISEWLEALQGLQAKLHDVDFTSAEHGQPFKISCDKELTYIYRPRHTSYEDAIREIYRLWYCQMLTNGFDLELTNKVKPVLNSLLAKTGQERLMSILIYLPQTLQDLRDRIKNQEYSLLFPIYLALYQITQCYEAEDLDSTVQ